MDIKVVGRDKSCPCGRQYYQGCYLLSDCLGHREEVLDCLILIVVEIVSLYFGRILGCIFIVGVEVISYLRRVW